VKRAKYTQIAINTPFHQKRNHGQASLSPTRYNSNVAYGRRVEALIDYLQEDEAELGEPLAKEAHNMAAELKNKVTNLPDGKAISVDKNLITVVALTPGFLRSEEMLEHFGVTEASWQEAVKKDHYFAESETPHYIGRAVVALASDPNIHEKNGKALATWHLSRKYDFKDIDGRQPHWQEFFENQEKVKGGK
jgi:hypothetical protein